MSRHSWGLAHLSLNAEKHMNVGVIIAHFIVRLYSLHIVVTCHGLLHLSQGHEYLIHGTVHSTQGIKVYITGTQHYIGIYVVY